MVAIMENVPLIITSHDGAVIKEVCASLSALGYASCAEVLQANELGVPQIRRRAFVIAYRSEMGIAPTMPPRSHERIGAAVELSLGSRRVRIEHDKQPYVSVDDAIGDLPSLGAGEGDEVLYYDSPPLSKFQEWA